MIRSNRGISARIECTIANLPLIVASETSGESAKIRLPPGGFSEPRVLEWTWLLRLIVRSSYRPAAIRFFNS